MICFLNVLLCGYLSGRAFVTLDKRLIFPLLEISFLYLPHLNPCGVTLGISNARIINIGEMKL